MWAGIGPSPPGAAEKQIFEKVTINPRNSNLYPKVKDLNYTVQYTLWKLTNVPDLFIKNYYFIAIVAYIIG